MSQKCVLIITDGIGYNPSPEFNAFAAAKKPNYERLFKEVPNTLLKTSGAAVGLPDGQMGNSEVGHMCIGSGRVIYQNLVRINRALNDGSLAQNANLQGFLQRVKKVHIIGLYSDGGVHSHLSHFKGIAKICKNAKKEVFAHAITDGRDCKPLSAIKFTQDLQEFCEENGVNFASVSGRFYAMDRDKRFERVKIYYDTLFGKTQKVQNLAEFVRKSCEKNETDEFIKPAINAEFTGLGEDDGLIFINFRNDRMKQIVAALTSEDFREFEREFVLKNAITMTNYDDKFTLPVLFEKENLQNTLAEVISRANLRQLHTAETEKYAHVTFFFNGGVENALIGETRILVPSPKVKTYNEKPEMSAFKVCEAVKNGIKEGFDFIVVNFANGDMVGHTGDFDAAVKAVEAVDTCLGEITSLAKSQNYGFIIISDHGNCEQMRDSEGNLLTNHTTFDVFCIVSASGVTALKSGLGLSNVAASVLKIMGLEKPMEMADGLF